MGLLAMAPALALPLAAAVVAAPGAAPAAAASTRPDGACPRPACASAARRLHPDPRLRLPIGQDEAGPSRSGSVAPARAPATFFVDAAVGRDRNAGTSPSAPWRSIARVDRGSYLGGDRILFRGAQRFSGTLRFSPANVTATSRRSRLTIGSYAGGQATLDAGRRDGLRAKNVAGFHISGLELSGATVGCKPRRYGILFYTEKSFTTLDQGIAVDHVNVHGFCTGIAVGSGDDNSLFAHVRLTELASHDNGDVGVFTFDPALGHHDIRDVYVSQVQAYNNDSTGGIALFGVDGGTVEHSVAHDNGRLGSGAVGIWAFDAAHITIQYSESYKNLTTSGDGDGFDLDGGVSNSVLQHDYAHDNQGIGFLVCGCVESYEMHDNVVRYNVSQNDGTNGQPSGLYVLGGEPFKNLDVFNNSFYSAAGAGTLVLLEGGGEDVAQVHLRNNLLAVGAGKPLLELPDPSHAPGLAIQGNDWWPTEGHFEVTWATRQLTSLAELRAVTGAETRAGVAVGKSAAPEVCALGQGGTIYPRAPGELKAYEPRTGSPLIDAGLNLASSFGTPVGSHDFGGDPIPQGSGFDIGAEERQPGEAC